MATLPKFGKRYAVTVGVKKFTMVCILTGPYSAMLKTVDGSMRISIDNYLSIIFCHPLEELVDSVCSLQLLE